MDDNKENSAGCSSGRSSVADNKKSKPKFHSQLSNMSFSSFAESLTGASGNTSPSSAPIPSTTIFPRVSLRSLLMNSPFSRRTKPKRGCTKSTSGL